MNRNQTKNLSNEIKLIVFIALLGAVAAVVFWLFRFVVSKGTLLLWEFLPEVTGQFLWYPVVVCTLGGLIIGLIRKKHGDYPQSMKVVLGTVKQTGSYPYRKMPVLLLAAILPLIFGSSVGPEAGMVGIITALCCWVGANAKFAGSRTREYSQVGAAVTLSVLFHSPLFGIFEMEENEDSRESTIPRNLKIFLYVIAIATALGMLTLMNRAFGKVSEGLPSFGTALPKGSDYVAMFLYLALGIALALFFQFSEKIFEKAADKTPPVVGETLAGLILGVTAMFVPMIKFSGEEQMAVLMTDFARFAPLALIGFAVLKVVITNICIQMGLKGGHFFPLIFAAVCLGYGTAMILYPADPSHMVFAAAIVTAATLGFSLKKPLAVTVLLFLCFPVRMVFWLFFAAAIAAFMNSLLLQNHKRDMKGSNTNGKEL